MTIAQQIASHLSSLGIGTYSEVDTSGNIFINFQPEDLESISIGIFTRPGLQEFGFNEYQIPKIQIITRSASQIEAEETGVEIYKALHGFADDYLDISGNYIVSILAMQPPYLLGRDQRARFEFSFNMYVDYLE